VRWLVDGMNVIGSRPDGWWRDRGGAMAKLVSELERFAETAPDAESVTVVLDGRPRDVGSPAAVQVAFAPGGRNAADDEIVRIVQADPDPASLTVVTSDRELAGRVGALGAQVTGTRAFRAQLDAAAKP
jgi:predicted RNA-binding protein with PIN domain